MARIPVKYVSFEPDRHGNPRYYFRKRGQPRIRLPDDPSSNAFSEAYKQAKEGKLAAAASDGRPDASKAIPDSLRWLCEHYYRGAAFKQLDARTRKVRKGILESICQTPHERDKQPYGDKPWRLMQRRHILRIRDEKADLPEAANGRVKALRQVFSHAIDYLNAESNPAKEVKYIETGSDGFHSWTIAEVEQFEARHPVGTKARLALALLLYTAQRRSDVVQFGRQHVKNEELTFTQHKGRNRNPITLTIPIHPTLREIIDASPCGDLTFLVTAFGKGFTSNGFGNWFRDRCNEAGLPNCSAHGLRKTSAAKLAERGATDREIMAVTGHKTSKEVTRYTAAAQQKLLAKNAMKR